MSLRTPDTLAILRGARALLARPDAWLRGVGARTSEGELCPSSSPAAACFCAIGVLNHLAPLGGWGKAHRALFAELPKAWCSRVKPSNVKDDHWVSVARFNDDPNTTHADLLALFDRAIASVAVRS